ncbi:MAG: hypothetical protein ABI855_19090, partial [Bacteroidota bacterium]
EVVFVNVNTNLNEIASGIKSLGYTVVDKEADLPRKVKGLLALEIKFLVSLAFTIPLLAHMVFHLELLHHPLLQMIYVFRL